MSSFSTINSQHTALRELEQKRLERMMGQLRKDVESKSGRSTPSAGGAARNGGRRFQPPRRRDPKAGDKPVAAPVAPVAPVAPPKAAARGPSPRRNIVSNAASRSSTPSSVRGAPDAHGLAPGAEASAATAERAQSIEIAWLWAMRSRMEDEAQEVVAFLARNGLDRYAAIFAEDSTGIGGSMGSLREADDAALAKLGLPSSPRRRILQAIRQEEDAEVAKAVEAAVAEQQQQQRQRQQQEQQQQQGTDAASRPASAGKWGVLGRVPPGWHQAGVPSEVPVRTRKTPVMLIETAVGSDEELDLEADPSEPFVNGASPLQSPSSSAATPAVLRPASRLAGARTAATPLFTPGAGRSRPSTAESFAQAVRPASSHGEKIPCYECYKQVYSQFAVTAEEDGQARRFCGPACVESFQQALYAREERMRELTELRKSVLGCADGTELSA